MARFPGTLVEETKKPRFGGVPVEAAAAPAAKPFVEPDPALNVPGASTPAPAAPAAEPSWLDNIFGAGQYAMETGAIMADRAREGASNIAGLPVDLINASPLILRLFGVDAQPFSPKPVGGSEFMNDLTKGFGLVPDAPEPEDPIQTILGRISEEVGAAAVPGAGILGAAAKTTLPAVRQAGGVSRYLLEPALVNPASFVGKEVAAATAAGTGAGIANTLVDRDTTAGQAADFGGALAGLTIGNIGAGVGRSLGDLLAAMKGNPKLVSQVTKENVADALISNSTVAGRSVKEVGDPADTSELVELLQRPSAAEQAIPGYKASTADRANDFGLANFENQQSKGDFAGVFDTRRQENASAVSTAVDATRPTEEPGAFFEALEGQRGLELERVDGDYQAALEAAQRALDPLSVDSTRTARGNAVRGDLLTARDAAQQRTSDAYAAADTSGNMIDPASLRQTLDNATSGMTQTELALLPEGIINRVRGLGAATVDDAGQQVAPGPVDLREATTLLSQVKEMRRAAVNEGRRNENRVLGQIEDALDDFVAANVTPDQRAALDVARQAKFDEAERFTRAGDPVAAALDVRPGGRPVMADERVAGSFLTPDRHLDRLFAEANTPATRTAIREEMLDRLDNSSTESIERFMSTFDPQIARFPGLADELRRAGAARANEAVTGAQRDFIRRFFGTPDGEVAGRGSVAKFLKYDESRADKAMENVISAGKPGEVMDELLTFVGDDAAAVQGARAAFWRVMEKEGRSRNSALETKDGMPWVPSQWRAFINKPNVEAVMERLYASDPEHLERIREIASALTDVDTAKKAGTIVNPSGTAQSLKSAVPLAEVQSKYYEVARGRVNAPYMVTYLATRIANRLISKQAKRAYDRLLAEVLENPDAAATLLTEYNPVNRAALARKAKGWLGNEASTLVDILDGDEDDEKEPIRITVTGGAKKEAE